MEDTIVAVSTPRGVGGIAVIRLSGSDALSIFSKAWKGISPAAFISHTAHLGWITDGEGKELDQVVATYYKAPKSYTGEDVIEISCHGSLWIQQELVNRMIECGAAPAIAGEFTRRAFINGRLDLAQVDAVADMIAASSRAASRLAVAQLRGDFSKKLEELRQRLVNLGVLLELELDFSEEDVEFADRSKLISLTQEIFNVVERLTASFKSGNAFKNGVTVAIAGIPNAGKSTLLNTLVGEERAIVSDIAGTTRDSIEDTIEIEGILFRFIDTAGLRESQDQIERIGVERARTIIENASILLYLIDPTQPLAPQLDELNSLAVNSEAVFVAVTKSDDAKAPEIECDFDIIEISAKKDIGISQLKKKLVESVTKDFNPEHEIILTNARHYDTLSKALQPLARLREGLENGISADFLAQELREVDSYLGEITGAVTSDEILHSIFERYCIGK